jgi:NAD+ synthetase
MHKRIVQKVREYLTANHELKSLVMGLSGGIDSGLTCVLAHEALVDVPSVRLITRNLPIESNTEEEIRRSEAVGRAFSDDYREKDLTQAYTGLYREYVSGSDRAVDGSEDEKIRRGNVKARIRMAYLFDLAHASRGMVLSTDNYTEFQLGFWTLHGDVGNYGMLQYLWKTEVYGLAKYRVDAYRGEGQQEKAEALQRCVEAVPTDGLGITTSDFDQIGVRDYETADRMLIDYLNGDHRLRDHPLIVRHRRSEFKRNDPRNIPREQIVR